MTTNRRNRRIENVSQTKPGDITFLTENILRDFLCDDDLEAAFYRINLHFSGEKIIKFVEAIVNQVVTLRDKDSCHKEAGAGKLVRSLIAKDIISTETALKTLTHKVVAELPDILSLNKSADTQLAGVMIEVFFDDNNLDWLVQTNADQLIKFSERTWNCFACKVLEQLRSIGGEKLVQDLVSKTKDYKLLPLQDLPWLKSPPEDTEASMGVQPNSYNDIKMTTCLLNQMCEKDIKIQPIIFRKPLFDESALAGVGPCSKEDMQNDIIRKNLYLIARKSKDPESLKNKLIELDVLTVDENEEINKLESPLQKAVKMFSMVMKKNEENFPIFMDALRNTDNANVLQILEKGLINGVTEEANNAEEQQEQLDEAVGGVPVNDLNNTMPISNQSQPLLEEPKEVVYLRRDESLKWACRLCTYLNYGGRCCAICHHSKVFGEVGEGLISKQCSRCTLINEPGIAECDACGTDL